MKKTHALWVLVVSLVSVVCFVGCQVAEEASPSPKTDNERVLGTWSLASTDPDYREAFSNMILSMFPPGYSLAQFNVNITQRVTFSSHNLFSMWLNFILSYRIIDPDNNIVEEVNQNKTNQDYGSYSLDTANKQLTMIPSDLTFTNIITYHFISDSQVRLIITNFVPGVTNYIYNKQ